MRKSSDNLFKLVKSLTKTEKRYIKLGLLNKQTEHIKLLDAILAQEIYDEEAIKLAYKNTAFAQNLAVYKHYLYQHILKRLRQYHSEDIASQVADKIRSAHILMDKELYTQAKTQLKMAKKMAQKYGMDNWLLLVLEAERKLHIQYKSSSFAQIKAFNELEKTVIQEIGKNSDYTYLFQQISQWQIQKQKVSEGQQAQHHIEEWRKNALLETSLETLSTKNKVLVLKSKAIYHFTKGEVKEASLFNQQLLHLLENAPLFNKQYPEEYISTVNNYIIDQLRLNNINAFERGLQLLDEIPQKKEFQQVKHIESRMFHQRYLLLFNYCYSQQDYAKALEHFPLFEAGYKKYKNQLKSHQLLTLYYLAAVLLFSNQAYSRAQDWIILVLQKSKESVVEDIVYYAYILEVFIHFELGNHEFVLSLLSSIQRNLTKYNDVLKSEKELFQYIRKYINTPAKKKKRQLTITMLDNIRSKKVNKIDLRLFNYIPIIAYFEKKIGDENQ